MPSLNEALLAASPRRSPPPTPVTSYLIHGSLLLLWVFLFARAFFLDNIFAWTAGIVYVFYDTALLCFVFWQTLPLLERAAVAAPAAVRRPTLGVIIAAHNEARVLPVTLEALLGQSDPPDHVVIADDGSTDASGEILAHRFELVAPPVGHMSAPSQAWPSLRWLRLPHGGKARVLNAAALLMDDEIVLTVDADTLLDKHAIGAMRAAFAADPDLVAATGVLEPACGPSIGGRLFEWFQTYEYIRNFLSRYAWMRMDSLLLISGAFAGFRRQALLDVGGFDAECLVEDYELIHRLRRFAVLRGLAWTTSVLGAARARTDAPSTIGAFLRQRRRWFGGFLQTQYWYRDMVGNRRFGWLGTLMLPVKALDTVQPIYGLTAFALLVTYLLRGRFALVGAIGGVIGAKILLDLGFHLWSVLLYRRWLGGPIRGNLFHAFLAALVEPFCFQILRHLGAAWGWVIVLTGERSWGRQSRAGFVPSAEGELGRGG